MLDLNITLVFQLVNFFIALYVLNLLLIRPIREIIRKRKAVMDDMSGESESYEYQAEQRLSDYDNQLTRARQDAGQNREKAREAGKPEAMLERIAEGSVKKFLKEVTLVNQPFVKDDKKSVADLLKAADAKIASYVLYVVGEGIEKRVDDFAAEVAAQQAAAAKA